MAKVEIIESRVLDCQEFIGTDGLRWKAVKLFCQGIEFIPGQFLMAVAKRKDFPWPVPLTIQKRCKEGVLVYLHPNSLLFGISSQEMLTLWGPCGTGLAPDNEYYAVSDGPGSLFIRPLAGEPQCKGWYILGDVQESPLFDGLEVQIHRMQSMEALWELLLPENDSTGWLAALPLDFAKRWQENAPVLVNQNTRILTGVKIGCGIGACRGCYIHSENKKQGIPVCQEGPFLPITSINYEQDQKFLAHYV